MKVLKAKEIVIFAIIGFALLFVGIFIGYEIEKQNEKTITGNAPVTSLTVSPTVFLMPNDTEITNPVTGNAIKLGASILKLPKGWYVTRIESSSKDLTKEDRIRYLKSEYLEVGSFPIYKGFVLVITNGKSTIEINQESDIISGAFGVVPDEMPKEWTVLEKATQSRIGGAREKIGSTYKYYPISFCFIGECNTYAYYNGFFTNDVIFSGQSSDLPIADKFYIDNFVGNVISPQRK